LLLGACKSVIGHTEAAAGVAGLIKAVLCLQHRRIPPNLHFDCPNPHIPFSDLQIRVADETYHLPSSGKVLAGVNAFGFGGTNVHVVLENDASVPVTQESARYSASERLISSPRWHLKPCWRESDMSLRRRTRPSDGELLGSRLFPSELTWDSELDIERFPWVEDHVVLSEAIFPAAAYVEIMNAAGKAVMPEAYFSLEDLMLERTLSLKPTGAATLRTRLDPVRMTLRIEDAGLGAEPVSLAQARLRRVAPGIPSGDVSWIEARSRCGRVLTAEMLYAAFRRQRYEYRGVFRTLIGARVGEAETVCELNLPPAPEGMLFHPAALDGVFQSLLAAQVPMDGAEPENVRFRIPHRIDELRIFGPLEGRLISHAVLEEGESETEAQGHVDVYDADGKRVCRVRGFHMRTADARKRTTTSSALFCRPLWSEITFPSSIPAAGAWALLGGTPTLRTQLAGDLRHRGGTVVECPHMPRNAREAARIAEKISKEVERAVVLWPAADEPTAEPSACQAQIRLIQALGALHDPVRLWTVTCGAHRVLPEDRVENPFVAAPWGLMRALCQQDAQAFWGGLIDVDADVSVSRLADALLAMDGEDQIALREGRRYALRLEQQRWDTPRSEVRFRADGAYVVTGGLGALGSQVAQWMVRKGARRILILGRRRNPGLHGKQLLARLRSMGAEADYASVPLDDLDVLADYLRTYRRSVRSPIRGLIHCAAHSEDQAWRDIDAGAFRRVFAAKAQAAWNLHLAFEGDPLEHFVLFSSLGGLLSLPGMASYAAANVVLDSLAQLRRSLGQPGLSIDWGPWNAGLAERDARTLEVFRCYGLHPFSLEEGLELLERLYFCPEAQAVIFAADRSVLGASPFLSLPLLERLAPVPCRDDPAQASDFPENGDYQTALHEICAAILETDLRSIDPNRPLSTYGLDSLNSLLLAHQVQSRWGVGLPPEILAADPPLAELAAFIAYRSCGNGLIRTK
jgi:aryl carrier-like protein/NADP-dependent 3-hydroxy acid dehydrogenase YdfG